jgi:hypothetical protein
MADDLARTLMEDFAGSTGISGKAMPCRYLWTDAFAVCNFLGLHRRTRENRYLEFALKSVDQVHHILGRHRDDDARYGWISGLPDEEGEQHPTCGGLRIGKKLNERGPNQPPDSQLEWDQDGQYFHYLTKWMHALYCVSQATAENRYLRWAVELAATAYKAFCREIFPGGPQRIVWKMSIDLSRPLVSSTGQHDPLDGLITCLELQTAEGAGASAGNSLTEAIAQMTETCAQGRWATTDPLGIGGLLNDATRLSQLVFQRGVERHELLCRLLVEAEASIYEFVRSSPFTRSAEQRLAFRELGLSISIHGLPLIGRRVAQDRELAAINDRLMQCQSLGKLIEDFWSDPGNRLSSTWLDHRDINSVMLATSLAPEGYLQL